MKAGDSKHTWVQCTCCGKIYSIKRNVPIDVMYIDIECPFCDDGTRGLNCGESLDDIYLYCDINIDPRYYKY